jgi:S1-C subfamily serine protease
MVHSVFKGSAAGLARLKAYDHLVAVDGIAIRNLEDIEAVMSEHAGDGPVVLEFLRPSGTANSFTLDLLAKLPVEGLESVAFKNEAGPRLSQAQ